VQKSISNKLLVFSTHPPPCAFSELRNGRTFFLRYDVPGGHHGHLPHHPELLAFIAGAGPGIAATETKAASPAELVDLAPTVAYLLNWRWPARYPGSTRPFRLAGRVLDNAAAQKQPPHTRATHAR
jgi:hypothetical protein